MTLIYGLVTRMGCSTMEPRPDGEWVQASELTRLTTELTAATYEQCAAWADKMAEGPEERGDKALAKDIRFFAEAIRALTPAAALAALARRDARIMREALEEPANQMNLTIWNKTRAAMDVLGERFRQISAEGWTATHDDEHDGGELAQAAATYALHSTGKWGHRALTWPWSAEWWKPTDRRRDLVKAGALIIAEIERIDRAAEIEKQATEGHTG